MDNTVENIVTYSNLLALTRAVMDKVGGDFQAPLDSATLDEVISSQVLNVVETLSKGQ